MESIAIDLAPEQIVRWLLDEDVVMPSTSWSMQCALIRRVN